MEKWLNVDWSEDLDIWFVFVGIFFNDLSQECLLKVLLLKKN